MIPTILINVSYIRETTMIFYKISGIASRFLHLSQQDLFISSSLLNNKQNNNKSNPCFFFVSNMFSYQNQFHITPYPKLDTLEFFWIELKKKIKFDSTACSQPRLFSLDFTWDQKSSTFYFNGRRKHNLTFQFMYRLD